MGPLLNYDGQGRPLQGTYILAEISKMKSKDLGEEALSREKSSAKV